MSSAKVERFRETWEERLTPLLRPDDAEYWQSNQKLTREARPYEVAARQSLGTNFPSYFQLGRGGKSAPRGHAHTARRSVGRLNPLFDDGQRGQRRPFAVTRSGAGHNERSSAPSAAPDNGRSFKEGPIGFRSRDGPPSCTSACDRRSNNRSRYS